MTPLEFLAEWAVRSSILISTGGMLLFAFRVKDPATRLMAWTLMLVASLAIPVLTAELPSTPFAIVRVTSRQVEAPVRTDEALTVLPPNTKIVRRGPVQRKSFDWAQAATAVYFLVSAGLLLRLCIGLVMSRRLLLGSRATGQATEGIEILESDFVAAPVTLGIVRQAIVLPSGWTQWSGPRVNAVLAHERSHIRRFDPAVQLLSAVHRALLWHSPLSWFLHKQIVRVAEEVSDDAAIATTGDRASYAEILLSFMRIGGQRAGWAGVPMARYGRADKRIHRILDGTSLSRGLTRWSAGAILALGAPLAYVVASPQPQVPAAVPAPAAVRAAAPQKAATAAGDLTFLGNAEAFSTVTVRPRIDGQLMSVDFNEGQKVQAGQLLASIDPRPLQVQLALAEGRLVKDQAQLADARVLQADQAAVDAAKLQLSYAQVTAPITGIAGLRLVDPGNMVRAADPQGIVVIVQLQPIAVLFNVPEDNLLQIQSRMKGGAALPVEAWNRDQTTRIATGHLAAIDNQIDTQTGTVKLKAEFDNRNGALFPNQFVLVHMPLKTP